MKTAVKIIPPKTVPKKHHRFSTFIAVILFLLLILTLAAGSMLGNSFRKKLNNLKTAAAQSENQINLLTSNLQTLQNNFNALQQWKVKYQNLILPILNTHQDQSENILSYANDMIRMATLWMNFGNTAQAVNVLSLANQHLAYLITPALNSIKKQIADDLTQLKSIPSVDNAKIISQLDTLNQKIQSFTIPVYQPIPAEEKTTAQTNANASSTWLNTVWFELKKLIVVHKTDLSSSRLTPEQQITIVKQNINEKILQTEWALLKQQPDLYQHNLTLIIQWLNQYFPNNADTPSIIRNLNQLASTNFGKNLPDLSSLITAISRVQIMMHSQPTQAIPQNTAQNHAPKTSAKNQTPQKELLPDVMNKNMQTKNNSMNKPIEM